MSERTRTRRVFTGLGLLTASAIALPSLAVATWPDREWSHGLVGTSSYLCGTDTGYASSAEGRMLSGSLIGLDLDVLAALEGTSLDLDAGGTLTVDPGTASNLGSTPPTHTYANPLSVSAVNGALSASTTALQLPLDWGSLGALNQWSQVSGYGTAAAASGLVSDSGAVLVGGSPGPSLPEPAAISLTELLPAVGGIADTDLSVGAVGASAVMDGCAALRSLYWGDGSVSGITRDYGIASLELDVNSPLVAAVSDSVTNTIIPGLESDLDVLLGADGLIADVFVNALDPLLGSLNLGAATGDVTLTGLDFSAAYDLLDDTLVGDGVTIDLASGIVSVDLEYFIGALNGQPANTELVINAAVVNSIVTNTTALLNDWQATLVAALGAAVDAATLTIDLSAVVSSPEILLVTPAIDILRIDLDATATIGDIRSNLLTLDVQVTTLADTGLIGTILNTLLGVTLAELTATIEGLETSLLTPITTLVVDTADDALTDAADDIAVLVTGIVSAVSSLLAGLPAVLSVLVNVQSTLSPASGKTTASYLGAALQIGLVDGGDVATLTLARAITGAITAP